MRWKLGVYRSLQGMRVLQVRGAVLGVPIIRTGGSIVIRAPNYGSDHFFGELQFLKDMGFSARIQKHQEGADRES